MLHNNQCNTKCLNIMCLSTVTLHKKILFKMRKKIPIRNKENEMG